MRVQLSMRSVGDCYNNAMCASVFATLECECSENEIHFTTRETDQDEWTQTIDPLITKRFVQKTNDQNRPTPVITPPSANGFLY
jgi:hypothetical protein